MMLDELEIDGIKAKVMFDPEISMYRGQFIGLINKTDFFAASKDTLREKGELALQVFLSGCLECGLDPYLEEC